MLFFPECSPVIRGALLWFEVLYCDSRCSQTLTGLSPALPGALLCNATRRLGDRKRVILCQRVRGSVRAVRAVQNTRVFQTETRFVADATDPSKCFQMLPDRLNAKWCAVRCLETTLPVLLNAPEVVEHNTRISWRVYSCLQNATKSNH